jgi:hypothetical protein
MLGAAHYSHSHANRPCRHETQRAQSYTAVPQMSPSVLSNLLAALLLLSQLTYR